MHLRKCMDIKWVCKTDRMASDALMLPDGRVVVIRDDQAFLIMVDGTEFAYSYNHIAPGHKPFAWSLVNTAAFSAHCAAHGCRYHPRDYIHRACAPFASDETCVRFQIQVNEVVQTGGGGYRCERRFKTVGFEKQIDLH